MIIKHPAPHHRESLCALWTEAFEEPKESFDLFYNTGFSPDRSMVIEEEDAVVAALYWFDCLWNEKKVAYLYAVATLKAHRGKGLCKKLMQATQEELKKQNYHGAILVPAEDSLFSFYEKMGYIPCCPGAIPPEKIICHPDHSPLCHPDQAQRVEGSSHQPHCQDSSTTLGMTKSANCPLKLTPISLEEYLTLQKTLLPKDAVLHTNIAYEYLKHFGEFYKTEKGILCKIEEDIQERLPHIPEGEMASMYLPLTEDKTLPAYFAHPLA